LSERTTVSWEKRKYSLSSTLKGAGFRSLSAVRLMRRLCDAGEAQLVLEAVAGVLLFEAVSSGKVPANAGSLTKDFALAAEGSLRDLAQSYLDEGAPVFRFAPVEAFHAELCKQWLRGFPPPIKEEVVVEGELSDPEVQDRLTVVALKLRSLLLERGELSGGMTDDTCDSLTLPVQALEGICRSAANELFLALKRPNEANHQLIHGKHDRTR